MILVIRECHQSLLTSRNTFRTNLLAYELGQTGLLLIVFHNGFWRLSDNVVTLQLNTVIAKNTEDRQIYNPWHRDGQKELV